MTRWLNSRRLFRRPISPDRHAVCQPFGDRQSTPRARHGRFAHRLKTSIRRRARPFPAFGWAAACSPISPSSTASAFRADWSILSATAPTHRACSRRSLGEADIRGAGRCRRLGARPLWRQALSHRSLDDRHAPNPYGAATKDNPTLSRIPMANVDPRHNGLFGAAFALAYAATTLPAGLEILTLSTLAGSFGLIAGEGEPCASGTMRPLGHL